tara:strand:+ start:9555 stop:10802 length:1248 start_codon:yes stop_codon:yes gene_type:complete
MKKKIIGFYCFHAFGLYDIVPLYREYFQQEHNDVYIITQKKYLKLVQENFDIKKDKIIFLDDFKNIFGSVFTSWFSLLCVSKDFSDMYSDRTKIIFRGYKKKILDHITFLNIKNYSLNSTYSKMIRFFYFFRIMKKIPLDFTKLYVTTKVFNPYILTPFENNIHLIVESWDHPAKFPFLMTPNSTESWNKYLNYELNEYQAYNNLIIGKGLKFRYIEEFNNHYSSNILNEIENEDINFIRENRVAIYPISTSSTFFAFEGEINFVKKLAIATKKQNIKLYVRPYPLAPHSDISELRKIKNVYVGIGNKIEDGKEVFNLNHMLHKYLIIKNTDYVINVATTFVFDAALVKSNCKIIQIKIKTNEFKDFGEYANGYHIKRYLSTSDSIYLNQLDFRLKDFTYKTYLRDWLSSSINLI